MDQMNTLVWKSTNSFLSIAVDWLFKRAALLDRFLKHATLHDRFFFGGIEMIIFIYG